MPIKHLLILPMVGALAACTMADGASPSVPESPAATATETLTPTPTGTADDGSPSPTEEATPTPGAELAVCENSEVGYAVSYPADWWANERLEADDPVTDIAACSYFAPDPVELEPGTDDLSGIAVRIEARQLGVDPEGEILSREDLTIDGREAVVREVELAPQLGFIPAGSLMYQYVVELEGDRSLVAIADNVQVDDATYDEAKAVLDGMMERIELPR